MRVAVVGAGVSGLAMARQLQRDGVEFTVFEKAGEVGGTWRDNRYPGLTIDVPAPVYTYAGDRAQRSRRWMPKGEEILDYHREYADRHDLRRHIRFDSPVVAATWLGDRWELVTGDGERHEFRAVVFACGYLHEPHTPAIPGLDTFAGTAVHSARWREGIAVNGRRVGIVGTGSTGVQLVSALAGRAIHVTHFQRTPQWVFPVPNFTIPARLRRFLARDGFAEGIASFADWFLGGASIRPGLRRRCFDAFGRAHLATVRDPELRRKLTPPDAPLCKRPVVSSHFYRAVQRPDVTVVTEAIERVRPEGIVTAGGTLHKLDVLILATGFHAHRFMSSVAITGEDGLQLTDAWSRGPHGYRTMAVPGFPNLFMLLGPHSPLLSFPVHMSAELQSRYVSQLLAVLAEPDVVSVAPSREATERWLEYIRAGMPGTVWATGCSSWYLGDGDTPVLWPYDRAQWRALLRTPDLSDFEVRKTGAPLPAAA